jgi:4-hydroxymandelate oxidase
MKYLCTYCSVFVYDEDNGDSTTDLKPGTTWNEIPDTWHCPVCGMPKEYLN